MTGSKAIAVQVTQAHFIDAALDPSKPVPAGIVDGAGQSTLKRFNVYRNNIIVGLVDALGTGFPATKALVGDAFFDAMAAEFARSSPPASPLMPEYGLDFPAFIAAFPPAQSLPYLADVARIESAMRRAYHAADVSPVAPQALTDPTVLSQRWHFAPAVRWLSSAYPAEDIRRAALGAQQTTHTAQDVLITRPEYDPIVTPFPRGTASLVDAMASGVSPSEAFDIAPKDLDITQFINTLVSGGAIIALERAS